MLYGYLPFKGNSENEANNIELFKNILEFQPELPDFLSEMSKDLINKILNSNPEKRINIKEIKKHPFYLKGKQLCKIDYSLCEKEIIKTRESFYKKNKEEKDKNNLIKEKNIYFLNNQNSKNITIDANIKSSAKNSIGFLSKKNYKYIVNDENNNYLTTSIQDNSLDKMTRAKLQILSLKSKNNQKNEVNSFKKKYNPVNLNIYNYNSKKIENMSNRLQQILTTETNENNHYGLPYIRLKDTESNII